MTVEELLPESERTQQEEPSENLEEEEESPEETEEEDVEEQTRDKTKKGQEFNLKGSVIGTFIEHRLSEDRDVKIIVTSKGSTTGLGKTTLAILICRFVQEILSGREWHADENGFVNVDRYISRYKNVEPYSALLIDEIERDADSRRAMSNTNVALSHAWAQLRYRNVVSVATLPSVSMLDNRMMELADIWINVVEKGKAISFYLWVNDFDGKVRKKMVEHPKTGSTEVLTWPDLAGDTDYEYMTKTKDANVRTDDASKLYEKEELDEKVEEAKKEIRDEMIRTIYHSEHTNVSQGKLGDIVGLSQSMIQVIVNEEN